MDILLPDYFDSREHWDNCSSIKTIHDQSRCVSGWAVASASAISDRICIQTNGKSKPELSALDLISCCTRCRVGCQFGYPKFAWDYWVRSGIVTGDSKGAFSGCLPYPFPKCDHGPTTLIHCVVTLPTNHLRVIIPVLLVIPFHMQLTNILESSSTLSEKMKVISGKRLCSMDRFKRVFTFIQISSITNLASINI
ncbi:unnamed protein product [Heterobilharzia americana]|nr:unnamed protein product [Heterobilharzia americana]